LKDFDLPDLAALIAPRPLWLVAPRTPTGGPAPRDHAVAQYRGAGGALRVVDRPEGWPFERLYADWLR